MEVPVPMVEVHVSDSPTARTIPFPCVVGVLVRLTLRITGAPSYARRLTCAYRNNILHHIVILVCTLKNSLQYRT